MHHFIMCGLTAVLPRKQQLLKATRLEQRNEQKRRDLEILQGASDTFACGQAQPGHSAPGGAYTTWSHQQSGTINSTQS